MKETPSTKTDNTKRITVTVYKKQKKPKKKERKGKVQVIHTGPRGSTSGGFAVFVQMSLGENGNKLTFHTPCF